MKGYSKIKGNNSFIPRSNSKKEFLFLDQDFELLSTKSNTKKAHVHNHEQEEQKPRIVVHENDHKHNKSASFFLGKTEDDYDNGDDDQGEKSKSKGGILKRNLSVSSYQKKNNTDNSKNISLERQSSTRAIQEAVKRAFSIKRSSSVNNSDRYSRIYDQPILMDNNNNNVDDCDYVYDNHHHHNYDHNNHDDYHDDVNCGNQDYDFERIESLETRSMKKNQDHYGRRHVGSKVVRACKRLFSR